MSPYYYEAIWNFFAHPAVIMSLTYLLGRLVIHEVIPNKKKDIIGLIVHIKNLLRHFELRHDQIFVSKKSSSRSDFEKEINDMAHVRDKIFISFNNLETEITTYLSGKKLLANLLYYIKDLTKVISQINKVVDTNSAFTSNLRNLGFDTSSLNQSEKDLIKSISKAKTLPIRRK